MGLRAITILTLFWSGLALADAEQVERGQLLYDQTCIACHGAKGHGAIPGVSDLTKPDGPLAKSDDELFSSIRDGFRSPTSVIEMPHHGGNPALTDEGIWDLIAYLRSSFGQQKM